MDAVATREPETDPDPGRREDPRLPLRVIGIYCLPMAGYQLHSTLFLLYFMKFGTDVLLIAPAAMGLILSVSRIWDGISDPLAGHLSDRTRSARGRRRSWMLASALPLAVTLVMMWSPPAALTGSALFAWMLLAVLLYETASTAFFVPYFALGMELTGSYHERTRLFGYRHVIMALGAPLGLGAFELMRRAEEPRQVAFFSMLGAGAVIAVLIVYAATRLSERAEHQGRGAVNLVRAVVSVFRNPHARLLLVVYGIETFGMATISTLAIYVMEYIMHSPELTIWFMVAGLLPSYVSTPVWVWLSRRFGKKRTWVSAMTICGVGFFAMYGVADASPLYLFSLAVVLGSAFGCGSILAPSVQADVIDFDELRTGERKEGAYTAVWNLVRKGAFGVAAGLMGVVLQVVGFEPNAEQAPETKQALLALFSVVPGTAYLVGAALFARFDLNEAEHDALRVELRARRGSRVGADAV